MGPPARKLIELHDGRYRTADGMPASHVIIARVPGYVAALLNARTCDIGMNSDALTKLMFKHRLRYSEFSLIEDLCGDSYCIRERPGALTLVGYPAGIDRPYLLAIKAAAQGDELWLSTFHRSTPMQMRSKLKRAIAQGMLFREPSTPFEE